MEIVDKIRIKKLATKFEKLLKSIGEGGETLEEEITSFVKSLSKWERKFIKEKQPILSSPTGFFILMRGIKMGVSIFDFIILFYLINLVFFIVKEKIVELYEVRE